MKFGVDGEAGLDFKIQSSLVLEIDGDGVIFTGGEELDFLGVLASMRRKRRNTSTKSPASSICTWDINAGSAIDCREQSMKLCVSSEAAKPANAHDETRTPTCRSPFVGSLSR